VSVPVLAPNAEEDRVSVSGYSAYVGVLQTHKVDIKVDIQVSTDSSLKAKAKGRHNIGSGHTVTSANPIVDDHINDQWRRRQRSAGSG